jgi:hypothetical protein
VHPAIFILLFVLGFILLLFLFEWVRSHFVEILKKVKNRSSVENVSVTSKEKGLLPPQFHNVTASAAPVVLAIYNSVKRYKDLYMTNLNKRYYFTARSKRYELRIILTVERKRQHFLHVELEGKHPHDFRLENFGSSPKFARKNSEITKEEVEPFINALSFFNNVEAKPDILSAETIVHSNDSMENWPQALSAFIRLSRYLMDSTVRKELLDAIDVLCPYCRGEFSEKDNIVSCSECKTRHHTECWEEVGRCAVFGCRSKSEIVITLN